MIEGHTSREYNKFSGVKISLIYIMELNTARQCCPEVNTEAFTLSEDGNGPVRYPVDGILDLHTFQPSEVKELIGDYISECLKKRIFRIRIIHGKGSGILRKVVRSRLRELPEVADFRTAGEEEGGWGATVVTLSPEAESG
jgi:dsDNA-specific endonuclease/ATPase MutS2